MAMTRLQELFRTRLRGWWGSDAPEIEQSIAELLSDVRTAGITSNVRRDPVKHREYMRIYQEKRRREAGIPTRSRTYNEESDLTSS